jgi:eukaryotic-like serine/threonine-protein kinase
VEPPSPQLGTLLAELGLAGPRELRRCRPLVRRLARDLPTFDSVWIDALTQIRALTSFQARVLESEHPERLKVGPCVLLDELERDGRWTLHIARHRGTRRRCLLTCYHSAGPDLPRSRDSVRALISSLRGLFHPSIVVPQGCDEFNGRLIVVSPFATGPTLQQLLIRRGRFPVPVVREIARQLLDGLSTLEQAGVCHGDLRLNTVRLSPRGQTILLNPGVLPAVGSRISFHDPLPADSYDGIAPELISSGAAANLRSDLYALGCLLWHLLSGRPPFPTGDRLGKLAAHQSRPIDDVRRWRPDTPDELATLITKLTSKDPAARPSGAREARLGARLGSRGGRGQLSSFHASFGAVAPRRGDSHRSAARFPWPVAATLLVLLSGVSLGLLDAGARNELLRLASRVTDSPTQVAGPRQPAGHSASAERGQSARPLPTTPVDGVIELEAGAVYEARDVKSDRPLTIRAAGGVATILIGEQPLRITAQTLHLSGIRLAPRDSEAAATTTATTRTTTTTTTENAGISAGQSASPVLLAVRAQQVALDHCALEVPTAGPLATAIAWKVVDEADPSGGRFVARHSTFRGPARGLDLHSMPRMIGFDNCLKRGAGPLIRFNSPYHATPLRVHLRQSTLREAGPVLHWTATAAAERIQPALLIVENSVVAPLSPERGLLDFAGEPPTGWERLLQITGEGSLLQPGTPLVTAQSSSIDAAGLRVEGLIIDDFEFAADTAEPAASLVVSTQAPRSTPTPPGIDPGRFFRQPPPPVVRQAAHEYNAQ